MNGKVYLRNLSKTPGQHLFCPNRDGCTPQIVMRLSHFASRDAMDIDTFSEKTARQLVDAGLLQEADQLYALERDQLTALERFGEKKKIILE